jgi:hypothetical protein
MDLTMGVISTQQERNIHPLWNRTVFREGDYGEIHQ